MIRIFNNCRLLLHFPILRLHFVSHLLSLPPSRHYPNQMEDHISLRSDLLIVIRWHASCLSPEARIKTNWSFLIKLSPDSRTTNSQFRLPAGVTLPLKSHDINIPTDSDSSAGGSHRQQSQTLMWYARSTISAKQIIIHPPLLQTRIKIPLSLPVRSEILRSIQVPPSHRPQSTLLLCCCPPHRWWIARENWFFDFNYKSNLVYQRTCQRVAKRCVYE